MPLQDTFRGNGHGKYRILDMRHIPLNAPSSSTEYTCAGQIRSELASAVARQQRALVDLDMRFFLVKL